MHTENRPRVWMHCASLGEFEQGRPVLEAIKKKYPQHAIVLTFFSPSGYEVRKNYQGVEYVYYLPMDTPSNAKRFVEIIQPKLVLWVKYEYWFNYLHQLKKKEIPVLLLSAIFRVDQPFFKWYGRAWKKLLSCFTAIFVQTEHSQKLLKETIEGLNIIIAGDTRYDRVQAIAAAAKPVQFIEELINGRPCIVAGSTWPEDELQWIHYAERESALLIIAPHEVSPQHLHDLQVRFPQAVLYSKLENCVEASVIIIDNIGMLSRLYQHATIAYIGGGFNASGIHNTLEAAAYGCPVVFGPNYEKFNEALLLVEKGAAFSIETPLELEAIVTKLLSDKEFYKISASASKSVVSNHIGATDKILSFIEENNLLTLIK